MASGDKKADSAGVVFPPPLIFLSFLVLGAVIDWLVPGASLRLPAPVRYVVCAFLVVAGLAIAASALRLFATARTRVEPWQPTTAIVTDGIYRHTRNPMYLAMALGYAGIAIALNGPVALLLLIPVLVTIQTYAIRREERYLEAKFGETYLAYKRSVRTWI